MPKEAIDGSVCLGQTVSGGEVGETFYELMNSTYLLYEI